MKTISQPMTCQSSLNVTGAFTCDGLTALNSTVPSVLFTTSSTVFNIPSSTIPSVFLKVRDYFK